MFYQMYLIEYPSFGISCIVGNFHKKPLTHCTRYKGILHDQKKIGMKRDVGFYRHETDRRRVCDRAGVFWRKSRFLSFDSLIGTLLLPIPG
jgi:hypothetical protein